MNKQQTNQQIATQVVGCRVRRHRSRHGDHWLYDLVVPGGVDHIDYLTEEGAWAATAHLDFLDDPAMLAVVLKAMTKRGCRLGIDQEDADWWSARFSNPNDPPGVDGCDHEGFGKTLQRAVCQGAILRVESLVRTP